MLLLRWSRGARAATRIREDDAAALGRAAAATGAGEFELFGLAYRRWHGVACPERDLERHFVAWLFGGPLPVWVRQHVREVLERERTGRLRATLIA